MDLKHRFNNHYFPLPVSNYITTLFCEVIRVSNRNSVAAELRASVLVLCGIVRNSAEITFPAIAHKQNPYALETIEVFIVIKGNVREFQVTLHANTTMLDLQRKKHLVL